MITETKICKTCLVEKSIEEFLLCGSWRKGNCKNCLSLKHKKWADEHKEHLRQYRRKLYHTNPSYKETCKKCSLEYKNNPSNKTRIRKTSLKYWRKWRQNPKNRVLASLRRRFSFVLNGNRKTDATLKLIGCSKEYLIEHIEKQFQSGMSWDNYGLFGWHIDHIKPCNSFDLSIPEEQRKCFHYTYLQPLWAKDNLKKKDYFVESN